MNSNAPPLLVDGNVQVLIYNSAYFAVRVAYNNYPAKRNQKMVYIA